MYKIVRFSQATTQSSLLNEPKVEQILNTNTVVRGSKNPEAEYKKDRVE